MTMRMDKTGSLFAWLELLRAPNLLTVPGDVLAGWLLVAGGVWHPTLLAAVAASLCLYALGLLSNDILDFKTDAKERPARPLPSRRISPPTAVSVALLLMIGALGCAWLAGRAAFDVGVLLFLVIALYNSMLKPAPVVGPLTMGLCRGLNLLLGAAASASVFAGQQLPPSGLRWALTAALVLLTYVALVTALARREVETGRAPLIGALLRGLLPLQAVFCLIANAGWPSWLAAAGLLLLWPISTVWAKRFYMS
jgi:4-hydroxybenzoate polyprenyltransferase